MARAQDEAERREADAYTTSHAGLPLAQVAVHHGQHGGEHQGREARDDEQVGHVAFHPYLTGAC